ncbi:MAG: bifunctional 5,10-methylene-tetrahydrofolate dehydrogenase/5,10-methylene-tetrahydrofolate [Clostridia bacterium]|nr:bifunctional 5,10-methylene-tetrahydrofolate dehydrogenase/5,10-methylene-tetrahydrofolate [Clostridia bacterium]
MQELRGMPVVNELTEKLKKDIIILNEHDIIPTLAIIRIGENEEDLSYERGAVKRFASVGAKVNVINLPKDCTQAQLENVLHTLNSDKDTHGILIFRPLPKTLSEDSLKNIINPDKDVDCFGSFGYAGLFSGDKNIYPPCTPQAVIELLDYYNIDVSGKKAVIIGRSSVVGKPLALMLLSRNATITVCHTKTINLPEECRRADILIAAAGAAKMVKSDYVNSNQIIIDVGINMEDNKLCGDVDYENAAPLVKAITPVPGGVGTITTAVLLKHTVKSAMLKLNY